MLMRMPAGLLRKINSQLTLAGQPPFGIGDMVGLRLACVASTWASGPHSTRRTRVVVDLAPEMELTKRNAASGACPLLP